MTDNESRVGRGGYKKLPCTAQTRDIRKFSESTTGLPSKDPGTIPGRSESVLYHACIHGDALVHNTYICLDNFIDITIHR